MIKKTTVIVLSFLIPYYLFTHPFLIISDDLGTRELSLQEGFLFYWPLEHYSIMGLFLKIGLLSIFSITIVAVEYYLKLHWRILHLLQGIVFLLLTVYTYYFLNDVPWVRLLLGGNTSFIKLPGYYLILLIELVVCVFSIVKGMKPDIRSGFLKRVFE